MPTLMRLLSEVTNKTGLQFVVPEKAYSKALAIPCFYSDGNGYRVIDELAQAFSIERFVLAATGQRANLCRQLEGFILGR